ncbi:chemotaxis protein CheW [Sodalinema gerasimenkoae]|uniref:chemotaxis protein CheW n=1 Tax=Sodalinema gerasimenkoae TaxID=2862348 RepID=UPI001C644308|nr:chemotaxis protein CheW [Sodalinema gerasimenkoae]
MSYPVDSSLNYPNLSLNVDAAAAVEGGNSQTGKFLQFYIGERDFALIPVETVAEIATVRLSEVLPVPEMRSCILGVYNWRGEMLWVVDFGELLGYPPLYGLRSSSSRSGSDILTSGAIAQTVAIVVEWNEQVIGFMVPQVLDLAVYNLAHLQAADVQLFPPAIVPYLQGYFIDERGELAIVIDIAEVFRLLQHPTTPSPYS